VLVGCGAPSAHDARPAPSDADWARARRELADLRATEPRGPYVANVAVTMHQPDGRVIDGRGAVAVDPRRALRMIILGPGGLTAIDAWVSTSAWRFAVPALPVVKRGTCASCDDARRMPIGFFRWWFLAPLDGELRAAQIEPDSIQYVLRAEPAAIELRLTREPARVASAPFVHLFGVRTEAGVVEEIDWRGQSLAPRAGDRASYVARASGLRVDVVVESVGASPPDAHAFDDPDRAEQAQ
jgi:hypothetical protein